jgi:hypothetical protein
MPLNKPQSCNQNWLDMKPVKGGRMCGQCSKVIVDFRKKSWKEIEALQDENNNTLCGLYSSKQLDNWGREVPSAFPACTKMAAATALMFSLTAFLPEKTLSANKSSVVHVTEAGDSSVISKVATHTIIQGHVLDFKTSQPLDYVNVFLKGRNYGTVTDSNGYYKIDLTPFQDSIGNLELTFSGIGMQQKIYVVKNTGDMEYNVALKEGPSTAFYVRKPTFGQWLRNKFRWFRKRNKYN